MRGDRRGVAWPNAGYGVAAGRDAVLGAELTHEEDRPASGILGRPHRGVVLPVGRVRLIGAQVAVVQLEIVDFPRGVPACGRRPLARQSTSTRNRRQDLDAGRPDQNQSKNQRERETATSADGVRGSHGEIREGTYCLASAVSKNEGAFLAGELALTCTAYS